MTAPPSKELADIAFNADGTVTLTTGTLDFGMGHATPFAQVLSEKLGVPFEKITLVQGDSDRIDDRRRQRRLKIADAQRHRDHRSRSQDHRKRQGGRQLRAGSGRVRYRIRPRPLRHRRHRPLDLGHGVWRRPCAKASAKLPADAPQSLDVHHISNGPGAATFPNGCHVAEVEVDPETGVVELVKYTCVNDFGTVVNPLIVAGQLHGGVVQGIGQALMEMTVYDGDGQLLTGSFMDYAMPRAADVPSFVLAEHPVPAKTNPLGAKGCGEAGCAGSLTSVMNAVLDALADRGIRHLDMPLTPFRIWQALQRCERRGRVAVAAMTQAISAPAARFGEWRIVAPVCAAHFVSHYYMIMLAPLFAFIRADYGVSYTDLALALTAFNVVSAVLQTPAGFLVDRIGARIVLMAGVALGAAAFAVAGLVHSFAVFVAMFAVAGLGNTAYHPADYSLLSHYTPPARIGQIFSIPYLRRNPRLRRGAGDAACDAKPFRLARRLCRRRHPGCDRAGAPDLPVADARPISLRKSIARRRRRRTAEPKRPAKRRAGGCCFRRRSCSIWAFSS